MCTIITTNKINQELVNQIKNDVLTNREGMSLVTFDGSQYEILKTYSTQTIESILQNKKIERVWFHSRMATTRAKGITFTHAFTSGKYIIMHNGIIRVGISYDVDTQIICDWLKHIQPTKIGSMLSSLGEQYANVFLIDTELHKYYVIRQQTGTLWTDNDGNYSTNAFDGIDVPVSHNTTEIYQHKEIVPLPSYGYNFFETKLISKYDDDDDSDLYGDWRKLDWLEIDELKKEVKGKKGAIFWSAIERLGLDKSKGLQRDQVLHALTEHQKLHYKRMNPRLNSKRA